MYQLTAADFADTGQWRLKLDIMPGGLKACLENTLHPEIPPQELCNVSWQSDITSECKNIEEAVFNNPRLLDDFATRIVVYDARTLLVPKEIAEATAHAEQDLYRKVYDAEEADIMIDWEEDITGVWCPGPGVKSFLSRTFPGARITCNLLEKIRQAKEISQDLTLFITERDGEVDMVLMKGKKLLSASTHAWQRDEDIEVLKKNLYAAYGIKSEDVECHSLKN